MDERITVCALDPDAVQRADRLAEQLGALRADTPGEGLALAVGRDGVSLTGFGLSLRGDFTQMLYRITNGRLSHEMLVKMAKTKSEHPLAVDATAGMGEDALLLAAAGYEVILFEQDAVIAALLRDAMNRAEGHPVLSEVIGRMKLIEGDSVVLMAEYVNSPDVVYLDPMFPERRKSGLIHKKLQLLQKLEKPCAEEEALLSAALSVHPKKIIIKRPLKGAFLAGRKPGYSVKGKAIRYDCIVP
ncbi:class I SAM-dependent methyltransferase [Ruminococcus sp.]|uniref:class I SAM-dependent methyltransferase n=1 Tax=Ruminococcus sp. TaxID=41978 RepID=UPI003890B91A